MSRDKFKKTEDKLYNYFNKEKKIATLNYRIELLKKQIDKIKKDILSLDSNYTFEELDYFSFKNGKEIIDYLNQKYIEYYRVYLDLMEDKVNEENYENSKVPLSY